MCGAWLQSSPHCRQVPVQGAFQLTHLLHSNKVVTALPEHLLLCEMRAPSQNPSRALPRVTSKSYLLLRATRRVKFSGQVQKENQQTWKLGVKEWWSLTVGRPQSTNQKFVRIRSQQNQNIKVFDQTGISTTFQCRTCREWKRIGQDRSVRRKRIRQNITALRLTKCRVHFFLSNPFVATLRPPKVVGCCITAVMHTQQITPWLCHLQRGPMLGSSQTWLVAIFTQKRFFRAFLDPFALCTYVCTLLRLFAPFCVRLHLERPHLGASDSLAACWVSSEKSAKSPMRSGSACGAFDCCKKVSSKVGGGSYMVWLTVHPLPRNYFDYSPQFWMSSAHSNSQERVSILKELCVTFVSSKTNDCCIWFGKQVMFFGQRVLWATPSPCHLVLQSC